MNAEQIRQQVAQMLTESETELAKAVKLDDDEGYTNIDTTMERYYEQGYRDALAHLLKQIQPTTNNQ